MRARLIGLVSAVVLVLAIAPGAAAITNGTYDGDAHPYVGLVALYAADGTYDGRCSGTLISPTVVVTAGHCTYGESYAYVFFDPDLTDSVLDFSNLIAAGQGIRGTPVTYPTYDPNDFYAYDVGVILLSQPVFMNTYGALPTPYLLDTLVAPRGSHVSLTHVGYGVQQLAGADISQRARYVADSPRVVNLYTALTGNVYMMTSNNNGRWRGGTCFGDSGGPTFLQATNQLVAITSWGISPNCTGVDYQMRLDLPDVLGWLYGFMG